MTRLLGRRESSAWQTIHMKFQDLFSLKKKKKKKKKNECRLLQILLGALRVNPVLGDVYSLENYSAIYEEAKSLIFILLCDFVLEATIRFSLARLICRNTPRKNCLNRDQIFSKFRILSIAHLHAYILSPNVLLKFYHKISRTVACKKRILT